MTRQQQRWGNRLGWSLCLLALWQLTGSAADLPGLPSDTSSEVEQRKFLDAVRRGWGNANVVTTDPNGSRRGKAGDFIIYSVGGNRQWCTNTSSGPDGGTSWQCNTMTDTGICFEGSSADAFETCFEITDPTADRTVTFPNSTLTFAPAAPALTFSTTNNAGSASSFVRTDATLALFDTTVPVTQAFGDVAATGSAGVAARRDHRHGMPATPDFAWKFVETLTMTGTSVSSSTLPTDADAFLLLFDNVVTGTGTLDLRFNADSDPNYRYLSVTGTTWAEATGQAQLVLVNAGTADNSGTVQFNRIGATTGHGVSSSVRSAASNAHTLSGAYVSTNAITSVTILGGTSLTGAVHLFKLSKQ